MSGHFCEQCICSSHAGGWICPENAGDLMVRIVINNTNIGGYTALCMTKTRTSPPHTHTQILDNVVRQL